MGKIRKESCLTAASYGAVLAALWLLLSVCGQYAPGVGQWVRQQLTGLENSRVQSAFGVLAQGLEQGDPWKEAVADCVQVFREGEN